MLAPDVLGPEVGVRLGGGTVEEVQIEHVALQVQGEVLGVPVGQVSGSSVVGRTGGARQPGAALEPVQVGVRIRAVVGGYDGGTRSG